MNEREEYILRRQLKQALDECDERQQYKFKQMYAFGKQETPIHDVVDNMEAEKLDWALQQISNTFKNRE